MSGFEAGHIEVFDSWAYAPEISDVQVRTGTYSLKIDGYAEVYASFPANISEVFGRVCFRPYYMTTEAYGNELIQLYDSAGGKQILIQLQQDIGLMQVRRGDYNDTLIGTGGRIYENHWHCVEFRLVVDNTAGIFQLKVDGKLVIDFSGDTQRTANANVRSFMLGREFLGEVRGYYDDIAFNDVSGGVNDSWIGRGGIPAIFPTGAGASTDLDLEPDSGEDNWEDVDEKPPDDDTSYIFSSIVDEHDSYTAEGLPTIGTISAVQWIARARSVLAGDPKIARILRIGGTDYQGTDMGIDVSYDFHSEIIDKDPDAGPGAWTKAAVDGMEIGVKVR